MYKIIVINIIGNTYVPQRSEAKERKMMQKNKAAAAALANDKGD